MRAEVIEVTRSVPTDFGGGSSPVKALVMAELIQFSQAELAVEVGVYRGRSFLPQAVAFRHIGRGRAIGVDPYESEAAVQTDAHEVGPAVVEWARTQDWDGLYLELSGRIERLGLGGQAELMRETSAAAAPRFGSASIGVLHIDGNHDRAAVELDISLWLPKVRPGGFVVLDDVSWASVRPAHAQLCATTERVFEIFDVRLGFHDREQLSDFAVFRVPA
jgi:predicted O-methyltransferase YrrM